ncbi:unnamed protein product [Linum trigynum]|uniref:Uncharacterized protein n=1 Tax=Linum trigynum TaxID=586398 RepID=A0AAV2CTG1_9ROSI
MLLERGLRWQVGNGQSVSLLQSNWIPGYQLDPPAYNPRILPEGGDPLVAEVIREGGGRWSDGMLSQWFDPPTCKAIKAIPLPRRDVPDKLIWHFTADGVFSVKTAYHLAVNLDRRRGVAFLGELDG